MTKWKGYSHFEGRQIYILGDDTDRVCFIPIHASRKPECQARARLIERAPEVLAALKECFHVIRSGDELTAVEAEAIEFLLSDIKGKSE